LAVTLLLLGVTASFLHKPLPAKDSRKNELSSERSALKKNWNLIEYNHDRLLEKGLVSTIKYLKIKDENEVNRKAGFQKITAKRKFLAYDFSFNGRPSKNHWFWMLGIFTTLLICSSYLAVKDARLQKAGLLKWYEPIASISFIAVSLFWLYHTIFQTTRDFEVTTYTLYLVLVLIPLSYFIYHALRGIKTMEDRFKSAIRNIFTYIYDSEKDLKEEKKEIHNVKRGKLIRETIDNVG